MCVPAAITEVDTADGGDVVIHDHDLFVVRPKLNRICERYSSERTFNWMGPREWHLDYQNDLDAS